MLEPSELELEPFTPAELEMLEPSELELEPFTPAELD